MGTFDRVFISTLILLWNSKPALLKRIDRKENQLWNAQQELMRQNGVCNQHRPLAQTSLDRKVEKLEHQLERLKRYLLIILCANSAH
jgi:hypothetical protein